MPWRRSATQAVSPIVRGRDQQQEHCLLQLYFHFKLVITVKATGNSQDPYSINVEKVRIGK